MNREKLVLIGLKSAICDLAGGLVCCIERSLFSNDGKIWKSFKHGFIIGFSSRALTEFLFYDNREKFKRSKKRKLNPLFILLFI